jgi:uncharacterized tellurite resistance protein B-like protein
MAIAALRNVLNIFGGGEPNPAERQQLVKEVLLMTLARAASADSNIQPVEVSTVQKVIKKATGEEVSTADVQVAGRSAVFETTSLASMLGKLSHKLDSQDRALVARSLAELIKSDLDVSDREIEFFDGVANALRLRPSELAGLTLAKS